MDLIREMQEESDELSDDDLAKLMKESIDGERIERAKRKLENLNKDKVIDCSKMNDVEIKEVIDKCVNISIYNFLIRISYYENKPKYITIYEIKKNIHHSINKKDSRLKEAACIWEFNKRENKKDTLTEIVRYLQMISKLGDFFF